MRKSEHKRAEPTQTERRVLLLVVVVVVVVVVRWWHIDQMGQPPRLGCLGMCAGQCAVVDVN